MAGPGLGRSLALLAASLAFSLVLAEGLLRLAGFEFDLAPDRIEFGWPDPKVIDPRYARDPELFWVTADYAEKLERLFTNDPGTGVMRHVDAATTARRRPRASAGSRCRRSDARAGHVPISSPP